MLKPICIIFPVLFQESVYIFREGMLPPHRQMFFQLCDLDVDRYHTTKRVVDVFKAFVSCHKCCVTQLFLLLQHQRGDKSEQRRGADV